jgi:hypothetical protein
MLKDMYAKMLEISQASVLASRRPLCEKTAARGDAKSEVKEEEFGG